MLRRDFRVRYLPILKELFESDTVIIFLIGLAEALLLGSCLQNNKKMGIAAGIAALVYGVCEVASNLHGNFLPQLFLLFLGTAALGSLAGSGFWMVLKSIDGR